MQMICAKNFGIQFRFIGMENANTVEDYISEKTDNSACTNITSLLYEAQIIKLNM